MIMEMLIRFIQDYCIEHDDEFQEWRKKKQHATEKDEDC